MATIDILKISIIEELEGALSEEKNKRYKNALILYSKAMFSLCDYIIAINKLKLPSDHKERFEILDRYFPAIYRIVRKVFGKYIDTYIKPSDKEGCERMKNAIREIEDIGKINSEIKEVIKKL